MTDKQQVIPTTNGVLHTLHNICEFENNTAKEMAGGKQHCRVLSGWQN